MSIKDYEILGTIGSGGMGIVYLARDPRLERKIAIKKIKFPFETDEKLNRDFLQRFYREARSVANLSHPNIIIIHDLGEDHLSNECFMVMEYLEGETMEALIELRGLIPVNLALKTTIQACEALHYVHQQNLVHRDIKPGNLFLCKNGMLKIMDFGLVRGYDNLDITDPGMLLGSLLFMPKEQLENAKNIDHTVDIYALGVSMYYSLSGRYPFDGGNIIQIMEKIRNAEPYPLTKANPEIPEELENIIFKALAKNSKERYHSMLEFQEALINYNHLRIRTVVSPFIYGRGDINLTEISDKPIFNENSKYPQVTPRISSELRHKFIENATLNQAKMSGGNNNATLVTKKSDKETVRFEHKETEIIHKDKITATALDLEQNPIKMKITPEFREKLKKSFSSPGLTDKSPITSQTTLAMLLTPEANKFTLEPIDNTLKNLYEIKNYLNNENEQMQKELKETVNAYNTSIAKMAGLTPEQYKKKIQDLRKKIDSLTLNKKEFQNELSYIEEKKKFYYKIKLSQCLRKNILTMIEDEVKQISSIEKITKFKNLPELFDDNSINIKAEIEKKLKLISQSVNQLKEIEMYKTEINKLEHNNDSNLEPIIGKISGFHEESGELEILLLNSLRKYKLYEFEFSNKETLFFGCHKIFLHRKEIESGFKGSTVLIKSKSFNNSPQGGAPVSGYRNNSPQGGAPVSGYRNNSPVNKEIKNKLVIGALIYRSKYRILRKELINNELDEHNILLMKLKKFVQILQRELISYFQKLIYLFSTSNSVFKGRIAKNMFYMSKLFELKTLTTSLWTKIINLEKQADGFLAEISKLLQELMTHLNNYG